MSRARPTWHGRAKTDNSHKNLRSSFGTIGAVIKFWLHFGSIENTPFVQISCVRSR